VEAAGLVLAKSHPHGALAAFAPVVMTAALVGFMVWIYQESRKERRK
jgi:cbb3-type cytochrome oxidase subunit 3